MHKGSLFKSLVKLAVLTKLFDQILSFNCSQSHTSTLTLPSNITNGSRHSSTVMCVISIIVSLQKYKLILSKMLIFCFFFLQRMTLFLKAF